MKLKPKNEKKQLKREDNTSHIKEAIDNMINSFGIKEKISTVVVKEKWRETFGDSIADQTENIYIYQKKLFVKLKSPALKQELLMRKSNIFKTIKAKFTDINLTEMILM